MKQENVLTPEQSVDQHTNADTDSDNNARHHTLGSGITQAASGAHRHTGRDSAKIAAGTITGSRGGGSIVALTNLLIALDAAGIIVNSTTT